MRSQYAYGVIRDVTAGATGATAVAPKFSDALTLFKPGGADSAHTSQRSHQKIPRGYISAVICSYSNYLVVLLIVLEILLGKEDIARKLKSNINESI